ncbi:MAG: DNA polymerase III subunit gamma/tau [Candidatus Krumholzibacteriota bacterium]|nr:DNA polymerase III subunit gamma/tau [Candidatus Krumholzibacteriota bacterium]
MSYVVLARKWRPQTFSEIVGQNHVSQTLKKAVEKNRLAHAYLFSGPRGCGKTTTARILAKIINCEKPEGGEPCNKCNSCREVSAGSHLDVIEIDGASNRGIDEIRDLREKIGYASTSGNSKIYIIDEVHMLTQQAFNALLKTLEEPPSHVYLILATTEPHKVPATIRSRCQRFNFKRMEFSELSQQLVRICENEKLKYDKEALQLISRRADGSMRDAESLLDQCVSAVDEKIDIKLVRQILGLVDSRIIIELLKAISRHNKKGSLEIVDRAVSSGFDLEEFFLAYLEGIRNMLVINIGEDKSIEWLDLTESEFEEIKEIAGQFNAEDLLLIFRMAVSSFREFRGAGQPRYHLEAVVAEAAGWESAVEISELISKIESGGNIGGANLNRREKSLEEVNGGKKRSKKKVSGKRSLKEENLSKGNEDMEVSQEETLSSFRERENVEAGKALAILGGSDKWEIFLSQIRESKLTLGIWLMSAVVIEVKNGNIILGFDANNRFAREMVSESKNRRYIENHLEKFFGRKLTIEVIEIVREKEKKKKIGKKKLSAKKRQDPNIDKLVESEPMVKRLIEEFDGEVYGENNKNGRTER